MGHGLILGVVVTVAACTRWAPLDSDPEHSNVEQGTGGTGGDDRTGADEAPASADMEDPSRDEWGGVEDSEGESEAGETTGADTGSGDDVGDLEAGEGTEGDDSADRGTGDESGTGDGTGTGSETGAEDETGTEPPLPCPAQTHACVDVPSGWDGPLAIAERRWSQALPICLGDYAEDGEVLFSDLLAPEPECTCLCPKEPNAPACEVTVREVSNCTDRVVAEQWALREGCTAFGPVTTHRSFETEVALVDPGHCEATAETRVEAARWQSKAGACRFTAEPLEAKCAEDQNCIPRPSDSFDGRVCIRRAGRHACPAPFVETTDWFRDEIHQLLDDRGCSECTCTPVDTRCGGKVTMHVDQTCGMAEIHPWAIGTCTTWTFATSLSSAAYVDAVDDPGFCMPAGGTPLGGALPQHPVTICCL